jgi:cytochrome c biogenesis factor
MASDEVSAGKVIVNVLVAVLSDPKFKTQTDAPVVLLYINAPRQVKEAGFQVTLAKDTYAVLEAALAAGGITVKILPPEVYPVPVISLTEV